MANTVRTNGFRPVKHLNGAPYNGMVNRYCIPASDGTAVFVGDAVKLAGSADADGIPTIAQAAAGNVCVGVVVGFEPNPDNLSLQHRVASTLRYAYVADSADLVFETQEDAVGGALALVDIGLNADFIVGAGSATTGQSGMQLDTSTKATTNTLPFRIHAFSTRPDNEVAVANAKVLVSFNTHQFRVGTGSTGI